MSSPLDDPRFSLVSSGRFRERFGLLGRGKPHSNKKLCFVATDVVRLIDLLYGLSLRDDCFYVKYGMIAREGMFLGRALLETDAAASELCEQLKGHPSLMVSLQDDGWFDEFRKPDAEVEACGIWDDWPEHATEVAHVLESAFGRPDEAQLVTALRAAGADTISLVAQLPPRERSHEPWPVVGHVLLSPVGVAGLPAPRGLGLAPLAVAPDQQRKGFGSRLVRAALHRARLLGNRYVVVLGDQAYYGRLGFMPASDFGLCYPDPALQPHFMAIELVAGALTGSAGVVRYHAAFGQSAT